LKSIDLEATRPQTLVHQDPHSLNWYWTGDGRMGIYDWQVNGKGSWALDVAYALGCGLSTEDRRAWERDLLAQYVERLAAFTAEPPSADAAWMSYRQQLMHGLSYWFASFGRMKLQPEMNTREVSEINITRLAQAAVDLDTVDAILSA
jgi:Ser/Thr protein kinase RdoA (MazF antagonist)